MANDPFGLPVPPGADVQVFYGNGNSSGPEPWRKPLGRSMCAMLAIGEGGNGGNGRVNANSSSGGGGGGGSGAVTYAIFPMFVLPEVLYISAGAGGGGNDTIIRTLPPDIGSPNQTLLLASAGGSGGDSSSSSGGAAGAAGSVATAALMPLGWLYAVLALAGQAGIIGGGAVAGGNLTLPVTGLIVTGGTGGGGLPAAAATGTNGGAFNTPAGVPNVFPSQLGGQGSATATNPANSGQPGNQIINAGAFFYGGTGGASTHGTATGGGLVQSNGGQGGIGSGGGGTGGALTGSAAGTPGRGGAGLVVITSW